MATQERRNNALKNSLKTTIIPLKCSKLGKKDKATIKLLCHWSHTKLLTFLSSFLHSVTPTAPNLRVHHCRRVKGSKKENRRYFSYQHLCFIKRCQVMNASVLQRIHIHIYQNSLCKKHILIWIWSIVLCYFIWCGKYLSFIFFCNFHIQFFIFSLPASKYRS